MSFASDRKGARRIPTLAEVFESYRAKRLHELRTEWAIALLYRPLSLALTPLFVACRATPGAVTLLGLACALSLPWLAIQGGADAGLIVAIVAMIFCVLDCLDGNIARVTGTATPAGAYADFLTDLIYRASFYAAIGLLADAQRAAVGGPAIVFGAGLATGLVCALLATLARAGRLYLDAEPAAVAPPPHAAEASAPLSWPARLFAFLSGLDHLLPVVLLVLAFLDLQAWALLWVLVQSSGDFLLTQRSAWQRLR